MGLLDMLIPGVGSNPFYQAFDQNRGKITGAFGGMVGAGNDPRQALVGFRDGLQHGVGVDQENAIIAAKKAEDAAKIEKEKAQQELVIQFLQQQAQGGPQSQTAQPLLTPGHNAPPGVPNQTMQHIQQKAPTDPRYAALLQGVQAGVISPADAFKTSLEYGKTDTSSGPYGGTGMDAQNWNILLTGDPASPEYAAAYSQVNQPKITYTQGPEGLVPVIQNPNIPASIRPPVGVAAQAGGGTAPPGGGSGPTAAPAIPGTVPKPTEAQTRAQLLSSVMAPEVKALLGDPENNIPGTFDALASGWDQMRGASGDIGRALGQGPSSDYQRAIPAIKTIISSYLYVTSGATATPGEVETQTNNLLPKFGEDPKSVADKKARLLTMYQAVLAAAGPTLAQGPRVGGGPPAAPANPADPLGLF